MLQRMLNHPFQFISDTVQSTYDGVKNGEISSIITVSVAALIVLAILLVFILREPRRRFFVSLKRKPQNIPMVVLTLAFVLYSFNLTHISNTTALIQGANIGLTGFATMLCSVLMLVCCLNAFPYRKKTNIPMLVIMFVLVGVVLFCDYYYFSRITSAIVEPTDGARTQVIADNKSALATSFRNYFAASDQKPSVIAGEIVEKLTGQFTSTVQEVRQPVPADYTSLMQTVHLERLQINADRLYVLTARNVVKLHALVVAFGALLAATLPLYAKLIRKIRTSINVEGNEDMAAIDISGE
jgi:hypothetical protein